MTPRFAESGVEECHGAACFPQLGEIAQVLGDLSRYRNRGDQAGQGRLLILSDSFGAEVTGYFSEYFGEVWQIGTNNVAQLDAEKVGRVRRILLDEYRPDVVVFVYHDAALEHGPTMIVDTLRLQ